MTVYKLVIAILFINLIEAAGQTSLWPNSSAPDVPQVSNTSSVTVGLKFYSDTAGYVTGVRFYKGASNTGTHVGSLWSSTGWYLTGAIFSGETASGWQQANFSPPILISANTTYIISYTAPNGGHAQDPNYPWSTLNTGPLHVAGSSPSVFTYGAGVLFPTSTWQNSNYWVDVVFSPTSTPAPAPAPAPTPTPTVDETSFWSTSTTPARPQVTSTAPVTLGLQFYSDVPGSVTGVRFYKGTNNTGTHVGALWSSTGTRLATATFSGETASGWQEVNFSSPVNIAANTTYVISYTAPNGSHAHDFYYPWSGVSSGPLHVADSSPGVFTYGSGTLFPTSTWNNSNYYVDVMFRPATSSGGSPNPAPSTYTISGRITGSSATVTLSGTTSRSTATDGSGNYSFTGLPNGAYVVAPSRSGYVFTPVTAPVSINGASVADVNFTAALQPIPDLRSVVLSWIPSISLNIRGYNIYRATVSEGPYTKLNTSLVALPTYIDSNVASGRTYYYVATAVDSNGNESSYSNQATAIVSGLL